MVLIIDNFDSFTYNLVQYMGELGASLSVVRNNAVSPADIAKMAPEKIVISPGPCTPKEAGISLETVKTFAGKVPILGVCLGHQSIGAAFGGNIIRASQLMHGKTSDIRHNGAGIFQGIDNPFTATRYHSLIIERETLPGCLDVTAWTDDGVIMAVRHRQFPVVGLQFHPESIMTGAGKALLKNFLSW